MAYGGGIFLPSETAYKDPNRFRDILEAEGNKQAKYLASMDQFYAQLDEMTRQFDVTTEQRERFFEEEMTFKYDELDWKSEESALDRSLQRWTVDQQMGLGYAQLGAQEDYWQGSLGVENRKVDAMGNASDLDREKFDFMRGIYGDVNDREQDTHDTALDLITGGSGGIRDYDDSGGAYGGGMPAPEEDSYNQYGRGYDGGGYGF